MKRAVQYGLPVLLLVAIGFVMLLPYRVFVVRTGSMRPAIPPKSAVVVQEHHFAPGEVISFYHRGEVVTHRFVGRSADGGIRTKGDANATADPWTIRAHDVIGRVVAAPRGLGYWLVYLKNPAGAASVLLAALCFWQIWSLVEQAEDRS